MYIFTFTTKIPNTMKKYLLIIFSFGFLFLEAQHCWPATAMIDLDINNIRAKLLNGGDMWWDGVSNPGYQYPKADTSLGELKKNIFFAGAIWMTALDAEGDLKCAAQTYRNQGHDFWPGPLVYGQNNIEDTTCTSFDRFFPILRTELVAHINAVNSASNSLNLSSIPLNILQWPAKGNQYLANTYNINIINDLAPFQDCNENGIYEPEKGDYPLMKGDQSIFWVINDLGNTHGRSGGDPLGVEIQCMAYAYITNDAVDDATFYDYKVLKKTPGNLTDFYFSQFLDPEIGGAEDDFMGCDTTLDYAFAYNADNNDIICGIDPPIVIVQMLKTSENVGMTAFTLFNNCGSGPQCDPDDAIGFRNYQEGKWGDGSLMACGGISFPFLYYGNPGGTMPPGTNSCNWSECANGNIPGDRRGLLSSGPYDLNTNAPLEFTIAVMVANINPNTYNGCPDKTTLINPVVNTVNNFIANVNDNPYACKVLSGITDFNDNENLVSIYPNPAQDFIIIKTADSFDLGSVQIYDNLGSLVKSNLKGNVLDVSKFSKGVYTVKIYNEKLNKIVIKKFVLK